MITPKQETLDQRQVEASALAGAHRGQRPGRERGDVALLDPVLVGIDDLRPLRFPPVVPLPPQPQIGLRDAVQRSFLIGEAQRGDVPGTGRGDGDGARQGRLQLIGRDQLRVHREAGHAADLGEGDGQISPAEAVGCAGRKCLRALHRADYLVRAGDSGGFTQGQCVPRSRC